MVGAPLKNGLRPEQLLEQQQKEIQPLKEQLDAHQRVKLAADVGEMLA